MKFQLKSDLPVVILIFLLQGCCSQEKADKATEALYSVSPKERNKAAMDLSACGSKAKKAVPKLIDLLYDDNVGVQSSAAFALRKIDTKEARAALDRATKSR